MRDRLKAVRIILFAVGVLLLGIVSVYAAAPATTQSISSIKVLTFNLRNSRAVDGLDSWPFRRAGLLERLKTLSPDLLGVQEARADQHDAIVEALADYTPVGVGRDDGKRGGEFASLFVRKARFDVMDSGNFWLSPTPEEVGSVGWDADLTRICSWALIKDKVDGREIVFANTHFDHKGKLARENSAKLIASRLPAMYPGRPVILTGDFNADDTTPAYKSILAAGWVDAYRQVHPTPTTNESSFGGFKGTTKGRRIDFIFASPEFEESAGEIDRSTFANGRWPSDHYPVWVELRRK